MKLPLSWLNDFVDIDGLSVEEIAKQLTLAGLEVEEIQYVCWQMPDDLERHEFKTTGIAWEKDKIVVAEIREVKPHPNADRLILCDLYDGKEEHVVLTGAPNLYEYKGIGELEKPIKVAWAKEGAEIYDGHQEGQVLVKLKRAKIRGLLKKLKKQQRTLEDKLEKTSDTGKRKRIKRDLKVLHAQRKKGVKLCREIKCKK